MKSRYSLFIFRTKIIYELLILYFFSIFTFVIDNNYDNPIVFVSTMLVSLYIAYFGYLKNQENKISFFYNGRTIKKLRLYTLKCTIFLSISFIPLVIYLGFYSRKPFIYCLYYIMIVTSFYIANYLVPINIEKKVNSKVITIKNLISSVVTCMLIMTLFYFLSTITQKLS